MEATAFKGHSLQTHALQVTMQWKPRAYEKCRETWEHEIKIISYILLEKALASPAI